MIMRINKSAKPPMAKAPIMDNSQTTKIIPISGVSGPAMLRSNQITKMVTRILIKVIGRPLM